MELIENGDIVGLRGIPIHLLNLNFLHYSKISKIDFKYSPLHIACLLGRIDIVHLIFTNKNININIKTDLLEYTPLMIAIYKGHFEITKFLLDNHAETSEFSKDGYFPILLCFLILEYENFKTESLYLFLKFIDLLMSYNANINISFDSSGDTILLKYIKHKIENEYELNRTCTVLKFLLERGANIYGTNYNNENAFDALDKAIKLNRFYNNEKCKKEIEFILKNTKHVYHKVTSEPCLSRVPTNILLENTRIDQLSSIDNAETTILNKNSNSSLLFSNNSYINEVSDIKKEECCMTF